MGMGRPNEGVEAELSATAAAVAADPDMAPPGGREKRRRSSLMALAGDKTFDPTSAVAGSLKNNKSMNMSTMEADMKKATELAKLN